MLVLIMSVMGACANAPTVRGPDIQTACGMGKEETASRISNTTELRVNAAAAQKRSQAADRISDADARYEPLAEALRIIADAAQELANAPDGELVSIDWDLVKLAQAAAADQCALIALYK